VISIDGDDFVANLMVIPLPNFDVILGMDWLHRYRAIISCFWKTVSLEAPSGQTITFQASAPSICVSKLISRSSNFEDWISLDISGEANHIHGD
jgi:hypothetical protein